MNRLEILLVIALSAGGVYGQTFDAAAIRVNKLDSSGVEGRRISIDAAPGSLTMRNVTLLSSIRWAYDVHDFQISGGPEWRDSARYDIVARPAAAASVDGLRTMLQALLADRFKLEVRRQSKEVSVYVLSQNKNDKDGPKLRQSKTEGPRSVRPDAGGLAFQNVTMQDFQQFLSGLPSMDRPVIDRTGLEGQFDFTLILFNNVDNGDVERNPAGAKSAFAGAGAAGYGDALARVGLKLEGQKVVLDAIFIEHAEKPTEN